MGTRMGEREKSKDRDSTFPDGGGLCTERIDMTSVDVSAFGLRTRRHAYNSDMLSECPMLDGGMNDER